MQNTLFLCIRQVWYPCVPVCRVRSEYIVLVYPAGLVSLCPCVQRAVRIHCSCVSSRFCILMSLYAEYIVLVYPAGFVSLRPCMQNTLFLCIQQVLYPYVPVCRIHCSCVSSRFGILMSLYAEYIVLVYPAGLVSLCPCMQNTLFLCIQQVLYPCVPVCRVWSEYTVLVYPAGFVSLCPCVQSAVSQGGGLCGGSEGSAPAVSLAPAHPVSCCLSATQTQHRR